jgi:hypothetical protein
LFAVFAAAFAVAVAALAVEAAAFATAKVEAISSCLVVLRLVVP